jgi:hypothetical protein
MAFLERDGFEYHDRRIRAAAGSVALTHIKQLAVTFDAEHMAAQIQRIEEAVDRDPSLAIGRRKSCSKPVAARFFRNDSSKRPRISIWCSSSKPPHRLRADGRSGKARRQSGYQLPILDE